MRFATIRADSFIPASTTVTPGGVRLVNSVQHEAPGENGTDAGVGVSSISLLRCRGGGVREDTATM